MHELTKKKVPTTHNNKQSVMNSKQRRRSGTVSFNDDALVETFCYIYPSDHGELVSNANKSNECSSADDGEPPQQQQEEHKPSPQAMAKRQKLRQKKARRRMRSVTLQNIIAKWEEEEIRFTH